MHGAYVSCRPPRLDKDGWGRQWTLVLWEKSTNATRLFQQTKGKRPVHHYERLHQAERWTGVCSDVARLRPIEAVCERQELGCGHCLALLLARTRERRGNRRRRTKKTDERGFSTVQREPLIGTTKSPIVLVFGLDLALRPFVVTQQAHLRVFRKRQTANITCSRLNQACHVAQQREKRSGRGRLGCLKRHALRLATPRYAVAENDCHCASHESGVAGCGSTHTTTLSH